MISFVIGRDPRGMRATYEDLYNASVVTVEVTKDANPIVSTSLVNSKKVLLANACITDMHFTNTSTF